MKKLIQGIVDFRRSAQKSYRESYGRLALGQAPDALFIACSDSRVVPNIFASTNPGDLFVLRNVGNLIAPCEDHGHSASDEAEAAALEYALLTLGVTDIVICGHSECAAMRALMDNRQTLPHPHLKNWLRHGDQALAEFRSGVTLDAALTPHNQLSQLNVLLQMKNVKSYPTVQQRLAENKLTIHGWWFDLAKADVYAFEEQFNRFILIDEIEAQRLLKRITL